MKYARFVEHNCPSDLIPYCLDYAKLKKGIKLLSSPHNNTSAFAELFQEQLKNVTEFFGRMEQIAMRNFDGTKRILSAGQETRVRSTSWPQESSASSQAEYNDSIERLRLLDCECNDLKIDRRQKLQAAKYLITALCNLLAYLQVNRMGFEKILHKIDNVDHKSTLQSLSNRLNNFMPTNRFQFLKSKTEEAIVTYADAMHAGNIGLAFSELNPPIISTEFDFFQRFDCISNPEYTQIQLNEQASKSELISKPELVETENCTGNLGKFALCTMLFLFLLGLPTFKDSSEQNAFAILLYISALWCTEAIPLFVTAIAVPILVVVLRVMKDPTTGLPASALDASAMIFKAMFSQVSMLLMGGFTLASAFAKYRLVQRLFGHLFLINNVNSKLVVLICMITAMISSMLVSNIAAPALCYSILQPYLRSLPSSASHYPKALILGVALASNIGGITTPISSPQNIIAYDLLSSGTEVSWIHWLAISIPTAALSLLLIWLLLITIYNPRKGEVQFSLEGIESSSEKFKWQEYFIIVISGITFLLWCFGSLVSKYIGTMGIIASIPILAFFGSGVLSKSDFNNFQWNIVMLTMGGLALGDSVRSSGLLNALSTSLSAAVPSHHIFVAVAFTSFFVLIVSCFVSHTVAALICLPLLQMMARSIAGSDHSTMIVLAATFACSAGMALPVSGFPNITALAQEDKYGRPYVNSTDFLKVGILSSLVMYVVIIALGYAIMSAFGF